MGTHLYDIVVYEAGDGGVSVLTSMTLLSMRLEMGECVARFVPRSLTPRDTDLPNLSRTTRSALLQTTTPSLLIRSENTPEVSGTMRYCEFVSS